MASSTLDLQVEGRQVLGKGHDTDALGPSDSSDTGSDMQGAGGGGAHEPGGITPTGRSVGDANLDSDSDAAGTGERSMAGRDSDVPDGGDIRFDRVVTADEAGLGGGLDQAEEARTGRLDDDADVRAADEVIARQDAERSGGRDVDSVRPIGERAQAADDAPRAGRSDTPAGDRPTRRPDDGKVMQSWAAALGAPMAGARSQADELARLRKQGLHPDIDDTDGGWSPTSPPDDEAAPAAPAPKRSAG